MKPTVLKTLLLSAVCVWTLLGCGGAGLSGSKAGVSSNAKLGSAKISIQWPKLTRLIPSTSQSIMITMTAVTSPPSGLPAIDLAHPISVSNTAVDYVSRPSGTDPVTNVSTVNLYAGSYIVTATAYSVANPDSSPPAPLATGTGTLTINAGSSSQTFSVTMASAVTNAALTVNSSTQTAFLSGTPTGTLTINAALPYSFTAQLQSASGQGLILYPTTLPTPLSYPISSSDSSLAPFVTTSTTGSQISGTLLANILAGSGGATGTLDLTYSEADALNPPSTSTSDTFPFSLTINPVQLSNTPTSVTGIVATSVLDCATVGQGQYLYLVSDGTFHYVVTNLAAPLTPAEKVGATDDRLAGIPGTTTEFYTGSTTGGTVSQWGGTSPGPLSVPTGPTLKDLKYSALGTTGQVYALFGTSIYKLSSATNSNYFTPTNPPSATSVSVDFGNGIDSFANLVSGQVYLDTNVTGTLSETSIVPSGIVAVAASNSSTPLTSGALVYVLTSGVAPKLEGISPKGVVVFTKNLPGLTLGGVTRLSVSVPGGSSDTVSGTIVTNGTTVVQF